MISESLEMLLQTKLVFTDDNYSGKVTISLKLISIVFLFYLVRNLSRPRESNPRPSLYESDALTTELGRRCVR